MDARTYELLYPLIGTVTTVLINEIFDMGAYVKLLEFDNSQGMLMTSEISRRRIRSISKLVKVGKSEIVSVIRVDNQKGYIDVSKRQIVEHEVFPMEKKWSYSKKINSITSFVARYLFLNFEDSKIRWVWPLYRKYGHAIKGIKGCMKNSKKTLIGLDIFKSEFNKLAEILIRKITKPENTIKVEFDLFFFSKNGIFKTKKILQKQLEIFKNKKLEIRLIVPPVYFIFLSNQHKKTGIKLLIIFLRKLFETTKRQNGNLIVRKMTIK